MLIYMEWMKSKVGYQPGNIWKNYLQQTKQAEISTQPLVWAFIWIRLSLVGPVYCHVCILIYCYCYVCTLSLLGFSVFYCYCSEKLQLRERNRGVSASMCVVFEVHCVFFAVFEVTSLNKGHWKSKCLCLSLFFTHSLSSPSTWSPSSQSLTISGC